MIQRTGFVLVFILTGIAACSSDATNDKANASSSSSGGSSSGDAGASSGSSGSTDNPDGGSSSGTVVIPSTPGWSDAKIGGGGFVTGGQVAADGTKFFRTDTSGGYLYDDKSGTFIQIIPKNLPSSANLFWNGGGVYEAMIAGSNSKVLYAAYGNALWKSSDGGQTFAAVKSDFTFDSNGGGMRTLERHGQIDPQNPDHVLFSDQVALYRSTDGGANWAKASGVAAAANVGSDTKGFSGIAFNPKSTLVNGRSGEAIASTGGKFFHTTDGGDTWTDISANGPNDEPQQGDWDAKGRYFIAASTTGDIWRWDNGTWLDTKLTNGYDTTFILDPDNADHITVNRAFDLAWVQSTDGGQTWDVNNTNWGTPQQKSVDDIPWHASNPHYFSANLVLDTANKTLWMPGGNQGVASIPLTGLTGPENSITADMHGKGIENLCINVMVAPTGSQKLHAAVWDESYAELDRGNSVFPSVVNDVTGLAPSWGLAGSKENPKYLARWLSGPVAKSGWTDDGGATWHAFATLPAGVTTDASVWGYGGTVAYSGIDNIIVVSSNTNSGLRQPYYTKDRGATWKPVTLPTPWTAANAANIHFAYYLNREILVADSSTIGRFYFMLQADDANFRGVYVTDDGGDTWTQASKGLPGAQDNGSWTYNAHIESPVTNHLWMGAGTQGTVGTPGSGQLFRSTDGGATFTPLPDVNEPAKFGFGAPAHAGGYPVLFMEGYVKGQPGVWMSPDADQANPTWISIGAAPNGVYVAPSFIAGDPDVPGRVWVATGCAGVQFGEFANLLP